MSLQQEFFVDVPQERILHSPRTAFGVASRAVDGNRNTQTTYEITNET